MAAQYFNAARRVCKGCTIVAADVLDSSNLVPWITTFRRHAKSPGIWGLHNYKDVHRLRDTSIAMLRKATAGRGQVWLTETGGIVRFAESIPYDERRAAKATAYVLKLAAKRRVSRVYLYKWTGEQLGHRWDSGLIAVDGRPRQALNVVEKHLRRPLDAPTAASQDREVSQGAGPPVGTPPRRSVKSRRTAALHLRGGPPALLDSFHEADGASNHGESTDRQSRSVRAASGGVSMRRLRPGLDAP